MMQEDSFYAAGVVTGVHGLRGDLKVRPHSGDPEALLATTRVQLVVGGCAPREYAVAGSREHKGWVLLRLSGLDSLEAVEGLVGAEVLSPYEELAELEEGEYYWHQLEGMTVVDSRLGELGTLDAYFTTAAHDTYVVNGRYGEVLIPVVDAFIREIDPDARRMTVELPEGLVELA